MNLGFLTMLWGPGIAYHEGWIAKMGLGLPKIAETWLVYVNVEYELGDGVQSFLKACESKEINGCS